MGEYYKITELEPGRYRIYDPLGVHMDLFEGSEKALLFDTGFGLGDLKETVKNITEKPLYIVNSHGHADHALGNYQFDEAIYIHPEDIPVCSEHHGENRKNIVINYARSAVDFFTGKPVGIIGPEFDGELYKSRKPGNLTQIREGHMFDLGDMHLEVVELPGHTPGSIGLLYQEAKILYAADAMNADFWLFMHEACKLSVYRKTLQKAWDIDFDSMIISHSPSALPKKVIRDYMEVAADVRYEEGYPFAAPLAPGADAKRIVRQGYRPEDADKEGFASIVISQDKID